MPNQYLLSELEGLTPAGNYQDVDSAGAAIDILVGIIAPEHTTVQRGFLDEMSPQAQRQLIVELRAIKEIVGDWNAGA